MWTTARTVYPGFPSRSAAPAVRARSMTRLRLGAPPAANTRGQGSRVTRRAAGAGAPRQVLPRHPHRRRDMARLRGEGDAAEYLVPGGELKAVGEAEQ